MERWRVVIQGKGAQLYGDDVPVEKWAKMPDWTDLDLLAVVAEQEHLGPD